MYIGTDFEEVTTMYVTRAHSSSQWHSLIIWHLTSDESSVTWFVDNIPMLHVDVEKLSAAVKNNVIKRTAQ